MNDYVSLLRIIKETKPDEIYNLAAQSHVAVSFELPEYTANADALGVLRILEAIKNSGFKNKIKFYQASTSELYGNIQNNKFKMKKHLLILQARMVLQNCMVIGLQEIIENLIICMLQMGYYLITNLHEEEKLLLQEK